ncbi:MAG: hypothetical protein M1812_004105 [Candelaria pacifica]|nr:MAG: hypothetical protein M1812_004105 [Candelaria pacifica]
MCGDSGEMSTFPLLTLPKELRLDIFTICFVRGRIVISASSDPRTAGQENSESITSVKPYLGILGVNRQVRDEAKTVYYRGNSFELGPLAGIHHLFPSDRYAFSLIRSLTIGFSPNTLSPKIRDEVRHGYRQRWVDESRYEENTVQACQNRARLLHNAEKRMLETIWKMRVLDLAAMVSLKSLHLDLEDCYCPTGCCRLVPALGKCILEMNVGQKLLAVSDFQVHGTLGLSERLQFMYEMTDLPE